MLSRISSFSASLLITEHFTESLKHVSDGKRTPNKTSLRCYSFLHFYPYVADFSLPCWLLISFCVCLRVHARISPSSPEFFKAAGVYTRASTVLMINTQMQLRETRRTIWLRLAVKSHQFSGSLSISHSQSLDAAAHSELCCRFTEWIGPFPLCKKSLPGLQLPDGSDSQGSDLPLLPTCMSWSVSPKSTELQLKLHSQTTRWFRSWGKKNIEAS